MPAGTWVVKAWHARAKESSRTVTVSGDGAVDVALTLDATRYRRVPHKNKHGKKYKKGRY